MKWLLLFAGGGLGSLLRFALATLVDARAGPPFPWGTLAVNVAGCFLIGLVATLADERSLLTPPLRLFLVAGVLGGFTTFSTFGMETWRLIEDGELVSALLNPLASMGFGMIALIAGVLIGRNVT
ncbi:MAG: fluoride efflux transporter CrcB [Myxococcales bacterium]|nr:fluoride efflux transporter CrcB [Myxococcales bacterium]